MAGGNTEYTEFRILSTGGGVKCFAVGVTASGQEDSFELGVIHHVTDSDAVMADYWTPARLKSLASDRRFSDALLIGGMLVFVCALERLVFVSELIQQQGRANLFSGLSLGSALQMLDRAHDSVFFHLPTLAGEDIFGVSYAI